MIDEICGTRRRHTSSITSKNQKRTRRKLRYTRVKANASVGIVKRKYHMGKLDVNGGENTKMNLIEIACDGADWIRL